MGYHMDEDSFRQRLDEYLQWRHDSDILFTEVKVGGDSFADYHVKRIKRDSNGSWDGEKAAQTINQLFALASSFERKCEHCDNVMQMHPGSNFCPKCEQRTFVPAQETSN